MIRIKFRPYSLALAAVFLTGCASISPPVGSVLPGSLSRVGDLPVLHLRGSPYEIGFQHGALLSSEVRASVLNVMAFVDREVKVPIIGRYLARRTLDRAWGKMRPFVPPSILEEMKGLSRGARIPIAALERVHALPELMATTCASFAAFGQATKDGRMIQIRNLDWAIQSDVQRYSALFVYFPEGKRPFVSVGWLGFIGVISGVNEQGISVAEIGAETVDADLRGIPMPFLLRRVLEESGNLEESVRLVELSSRTGGYNYLFADASRSSAVALETTRGRCRVFWIDQEPDHPFGLRVMNTIFRSDFALDPSVRELQTASRGDPESPGLESPVGSSAYDTRYRGQGALLAQFYGKVDPEVAMTVARAIAPASNIQSIVYAYPQLWIANAKGRQPAAIGRYVQVDLRDLFKKE